MYSLVEMAEDDTGEGGDQLIRSKFSSVCELPNRGVGQHCTLFTPGTEFHYDSPCFEMRESAHMCRFTHVIRTFTCRVLQGRYPIICRPSKASTASSASSLKARSPINTTTTTTAVVRRFVKIAEFVNCEECA